MGLDKIKDLPTQKQKEQEDFAKAKKIERIMGVLNCDGWADVKDILLQEAKSEELVSELVKKGVTDFDKIGQLVYLEKRANDKIIQGIQNVEKLLR